MHGPEGDWRMRLSLAKSLTRVSTLVDLRLYRKCTRALTNQNLSVDEGVAGGGEGGDWGEGMDVEEGGSSSVSSPASSLVPSAGGSQQEGSSLPAVSSNSVSFGMFSNSVSSEMSADGQIAVDALNPASLRQSSLIVDASRMDATTLGLNGTHHEMRLCWRWRPAPHSSTPPPVSILLYQRVQVKNRFNQSLLRPREG